MNCKSLGRISDPLSEITTDSSVPELWKDEMAGFVGRLGFFDQLFVDSDCVGSGAPAVRDFLNLWENRW